MAGSMKRRMMSVGAALALTVTACSGTSDSDQAGGASGKPEDTGPVKLLLFGDPHELKAYNDLISAYSAKHDGRRIQIVEASDRSDLIARLSTSIAGGSPPDVFLLNYRYYGAVRRQERARAGRRPAEDLDGDQGVRLLPDGAGRFHAGAASYACMPQNVSSLVVYYNRALFKKYGVAEPPAQAGPSTRHGGHGDSS